MKMIRNFAEEWLKYSDQTGNDVFFSFMIRWMAFNWLYETYYDDRHPGWRRHYREHPEIKRLKEYINTYEIVFNKSDLFSILPPEAEMFKKEITVHGVPYTIDFERLLMREYSGLFSTIYHIRCNLFHGSKTPYNLRDVELVEEATSILDPALRTLLEHHAFP